MKKIFLLFTFLSTLLIAADLEDALRFYEKKDFARAFSIFKNLCDNKNSAKSCFSLAYMYENAQGVAQSFEKAYTLYDKSCKLGLASACMSLALLLNNNSYENQAILAFNRACNLLDKQGCAIVGQFWENQKDGSMAADFYKRACDLKDADACYKMGKLYEKGDLIRQNLRLALSAYSKSCDLNLAEACYLLGRYYELEKKDMPSAKRYFGLACDNQSEEGCAAYKELNNQNPQQ